MPNYYDDDSGSMDDSAEPSMAEEDAKDPKDKKYRDDNQITALLPKSILAGKHFDVGEEVVLEIVHEYEDEIEVKYASNGKDKKDESMDESDRGDEMNNSMKTLEESMS